MTSDQIYLEARIPNQLYLSHIRRSQHYRMDREHAHEEWELYYLLSGERRYFLRDHVVSVHKGDLILVPSGEIHKSLPVKDAAHERISVEFKREYLAPLLSALPQLELLSHFQTGRVLHLGDPLRHWIHQELFGMLSTAKAGAAGWEDSVRLRLARMLLELVQHDASVVADGRASVGDAMTNETGDRKGGGRSASPEWLPRLLDDMALRYGEKITLTDAAAHQFLHPSYLSRAFRQATGLTFIQYLTGIRVREARMLLEKTDRTSQDIAESCGFGDVAAFGRVFKQATGLSPGRYRLLHAGKPRKKHVAAPMEPPRVTAAHR